MANPILLGSLPSPFVRKTLVFLEEKGIAHEHRNLAPVPKTPELLAMNPLGKVPILKHDDLVVPDSSAICAYLERVQPSPALYPQDPREFAQALFLEEYADAKLIACTSAAIFECFVKPVVMKQPPDAEAIAKQLDGDLPPALDWLEQNLHSSSGLVAGRYSIADIAVAAQLVSIGYADRVIDAKRWPRVADWLAATRARPAWKTILAKEPI